MAMTSHSDNIAKGKASYEPSWVHALRRRVSQDDAPGIPAVAGSRLGTFSLTQFSKGYLQMEEIHHCKHDYEKGGPLQAGESNRKHRHLSKVP